MKRFERSNGLDTALYKNYFFSSMNCVFRFSKRSKCMEKEDDDNDQKSDATDWARHGAR